MCKTLKRLIGNLRKYVLIIISFARCHNIILNKHNKFEDSEVCEE